MKKRLPLFATVIAVAVASLFLNFQNAIAQTPANAFWALTTDASVVTTGAVTATPFMLGSGMTLNQYNINVGATGTGAAGTSFTDAQTGNAYYEFSVSPAGGNDFTVDSIGFDHSSVSFTTGPDYVLQYSMDGFTTAGTDIGTSAPVPVSLTGNAHVSNPFSQKVNSGQTLTMRIYVWNLPTLAAYVCSNFGVYGSTLAVGVNEHGSNSMAFVLSPNPAHAAVTIKMNKAELNAELVVYDAMGAVALKQVINGDQAVIEKGNLSAGIYFAVLNEGSNRLIQRLIIQ